MDAPEIWESVAAFLQYSIDDIVPCRQEPHSSSLSLLGQEVPCSEVREDWVHLIGAYMDQVDFHGD